MTRIDVVMTNTTPYHSSQPGESRCDINGRFVQMGGFPCIRTMHMPFVCDPSVAFDDDEGGDGIASSRWLPVMPANSLRNSLRRALFGLVMDRMAGDHTISTGAYAAALCGNASGTPDGIAANYAETLAVRNHVLLGLFGGGPRMIEGRLRVSDAKPIVADLEPLLPPGLQPFMVRGRLTAVRFGRRNDPLAIDPVSAADVVAGGAESVTAWLAESAGDREDSPRGLRSFSAHEYVMPGVRWSWSIFLDRPTDEQLGAVLIAISAQEKMLHGGMSRIGYGEMRIDQVLVDGVDALRWGSMKEKIISGMRAIDAITPDELESFAASQKQPDEKKKGKK